MFISRNELHDIKRNMGQMAVKINLLEQEIARNIKDTAAISRRGMGDSLCEMDKLFFDRIEAIKEYLGGEWGNKNIPDPSYFNVPTPYVEKVILKKKSK